MVDHPHLTLVDPHKMGEHDREFIPLPYYPWESRPETVPLDTDECATAIHIARGHIPRAADLLKVAEFKLARMVRHHPHLARIQSEELELEVHKAAWEYSKALDSDNDRRREWGRARSWRARSLSLILSRRRLRSRVWRI